MRRARAILLGLAFVSSFHAASRAERPDPKLALSRDGETTRDLTPLRRPQADTRQRGNRSSGGWWFSSAGIVLVLAVLGGGSLAMKRWKLVPGREAGALEVVGRTFLTPRHAVYLVRAGGRTLLIGTGPQGAPSLLGELSADAAAAPKPGGVR